MLPVPPLEGIDKTVKFMLPNIAKKTQAQEVIIKPTHRDSPMGYNCIKGEFYNPDKNKGKDKNVIFIPLRKNGWIAISNAEEAIDENLLQQYCSQAIDNAEEYDNMKRQSMLDVLTELPNRTALRTHLYSEIKKCSILCLVFADLDDFKRINDTYGHIMGDDILENTARILEKSIRPSDFLARYGGDEFVIILSETGIEQGRVVLERLKEKLVYVNVDNLKVQMSIGIAEYPTDSESIDGLISIADSRMYKDKRLKQQGRLYNNV